jgi:hypothetical protein
MRAHEITCRGLTIVAMLTFLSSCTAAPDHGRTSTVERSSIGAGPREQTFSERYGLNLTLPMDERAFLNTLDGLKLQYELYGERGSAREVPPSRHSFLDLSKVLRCYQIYGDQDVKRGVGAVYRAYVSDAHQVIYIENAFEYAGP